MTLAVLPFAVFFGCCLLQFWLLRRVRRALAERHPTLWLEMSGKALFTDNAVYKFIWARRDQTLGDAELTRAAQHLRRLSVVALLAWLTMVALMLSGRG